MEVEITIKIKLSSDDNVNLENSVCKILETPNIIRKKIYKQNKSIFTNSVYVNDEYTIEVNR